MLIEWDAAKDDANRSKYGIAFSEAKELFDSGVDYLEIYDEIHSDYEDRFIAIGPIPRGLVVIVWTEREEYVVRIISVRWATKKEGQLYLKCLEDNHA